MPPPGALAAVELAAVAAPTDRDLHVFLGSLYAHYGRHAQAAAVLGELLAASPFDEATRLQYAHALIGAGDAYTAYRHLRVLSPNAETTTDLYLAGIAAHNAGRFHESLRILQEVVRRDPGLFDVEERVAEASARAVRNRLGRYELGETVAVHEACLLHRAAHPEHGEVLLLAFRRDFSDALEFPVAFSEQFGGTPEQIPGCARVRDAGSDEEEFYVAYEMPAGAPVSQILEMRGPMPPQEAIQTMAQVVASLGELHDAGRLHGDLRPSAVWFDDEAGATLVGAGAALVAEAEPAATPPGARSPFHVAPEVVQRHELSVASDIYAAGCMFYELLVGAPPLQGPTHLATMMAHVTIQPEPPSMRVPNVPQAIDDLVLWALAKDPSQRPHSAADFVRRLREVGPGVEEVEAEWAEEGVHVGEGPVSLETAPGPPDPTRWWTSYHELTLVANGRFARVYRGSHRQSGAWHAVKHLQVPRAASTAEGLKSARAAQAILKLFENEMHLLQSLSEADPPVTGITTMLQAYRADETSPAYAMLPMEENLAARLQREGPLPEGEAVQAFVSLAQTVATLHERGIAHRGLSPRSVMFDRAGRIVLGGFDGACRLSERGALLLAEHEVQQATRSPLYVLGDARYLSPERCRGEEFDERTDVYSLGALLFFMLTGVAPFDRVDEMQIMLDHVSSPPPRVRERGVEVAPRTQEVIDHALAKSPGARFPSATEMVSALAGEAPPPRY